MKNKWLHIFTIVAFTQILPCVLFGQTWKFIKEKDGIQLYSRRDADKGLKIFKGVGEIEASADKVYGLLEDVNHTEWWTKEVSQIKILQYEKDKQAQCYLVYSLPWPFLDRDLCVNVTATINRSTGERKLTSLPLFGVTPERDGLVRIKEYMEEWIIRPIDKNRSHVEFEFYLNPGNNLPAWLINMVLGDAPIHMIKSVRKYMK
jgi:hypothetical protein